MKGYSDPEVVSVLLSWLGLRATLIGEVCTVDFSVASELWFHLESGQYFSEPLGLSQVLRSLFRCCLRSVVDFLGALDDSQL